MILLLSTVYVYTFIKFHVVRKCPCLALEGEGDKNHFVFECCDWLFGFGCFVEGRQGIPLVFSSDT